MSFNDDVYYIYIYINILFKYFPCVEEIEWAIESAKTFGKPVVASMCMGPKGDKQGVSVGECAVRMAKAGWFGVTSVI